MQFSLLLLTTLISLAASAPASTTPTSTVPSSRVTAFPVCGTLGYTEEPGDHYLAIYPPPPVTLKECVKACRRNHTCKSVSYAAVYSLCSFYSEFMKHDQLDEDATSNFAHYDKVCRLKNLA